MALPHQQQRLRACQESTGVSIRPDLLTQALWVSSPGGAEAPRLLLGLRATGLLDEMWTEWTVLLFFMWIYSEYRVTQG